MTVNFNADVTITISREDADYMAEDEWVDNRLKRIAEACRATLKKTINGSTETRWMDNSVNDIIPKIQLQSIYQTYHEGKTNG